MSLLGIENRKRRFKISDLKALAITLINAKSILEARVKRLDGHVNAMHRTRDLRLGKIENYKKLVLMLTGSKANLAARVPWLEGRLETTQRQKSSVLYSALELQQDWKEEVEHMEAMKSVNNLRVPEMMDAFRAEANVLLAQLFQREKQLTEALGNNANITKQRDDAGAKLQRMKDTHCAPLSQRRPGPIFSPKKDTAASSVSGSRSYIHIYKHEKFSGT